MDVMDSTFALVAMNFSDCGRDFPCNKASIKFEKVVKEMEKKDGRKVVK